MNELMIFDNPEFGEIRTVEIDGEPWLVGKDVAQALGYNDTDKAIRNHVDDDDKLTRQFGGSGQNRNMTIINESGVYSLVFSSKLPGAKAFKHWVTSEVLPSIRKHGGYLSPAMSKTLDDLTAAVRLLSEQLDAIHLRDDGECIQALRIPEPFEDEAEPATNVAARRRWMRTVNEKLDLLSIKLNQPHNLSLSQIYRILENKWDAVLDEERLRAIEKYNLTDCSILAAIFYNAALRDGFQKIVDYNLAPENRGW